MLALLDEADPETLLPRFSDTLRNLTEWRDDGPRGGIHGRPAIEDMYETMYAPGKPWAAGKVEEPLAGVLSNRGGYTPEPQYAEHGRGGGGEADHESDKRKWAQAQIDADAFRVCRAMCGAATCKRTDDLPCVAGAQRGQDRPVCRAATEVRVS